MEVLCYTRVPKEDIIYANRLAYSMHLAFREGSGEYQAFRHNEGILYAKATDNEDGTLNAMSLKAPWLFVKDTLEYGVVAIRTKADGEVDSESNGCVLVFESKDLVHYQEKGLFRLQSSGTIKSVSCIYNKEKNIYDLYWETTDGIKMMGEGNPFKENYLRNSNLAENVTMPWEKTVVNESDLSNIEGIVPSNVIEIPDEHAEYLKKKLMTPFCTSMKLSKQGLFKTKEELNEVKAIASYSDGGMCERKIDWNMDTSDKKIIGKVHQEVFPVPIVEHRADPCCMYWKGKYYFIATNDFDDNHTLYIRCSETLEDIITAKEELILDSSTYEGIGGLLWAPEFHEIGGSMYIFHAATSGEFFHEESRVMKLRDGGDPMCKDDWSAPQMVVKKDGTPLCDEGNVISLDMTTFTYEEKTYAMWSQRQFLPVDQGAWLYLAQIDEKEPWKLVSDPVCIAKPDYGWENNHTFVVEGPYALWKNGQLMLTYSGAAVDATYSVGLLKPIMGSDILDPNNWQKNNYPLMTSGCAEGEYGPGHNSYLTDENGLVWNFYHARIGVENPRSSCARRVYFDVDGEPMLDVLKERDLPEIYQMVEAELA